MIFSFNEFEFDSEQCLLSKAGKVVQLSEKPALLLRLFLLESNKIHSKAVLLEMIWPDRVVTEQVVFQNISYLRALFGDDAIKTYPKKGYQWQLPNEVIDKSSDGALLEKLTLIPHAAVKKHLPSFFQFNNRHLLSTLLIILLCIALLWSFLKSQIPEVENETNSNTLVTLFKVEQTGSYKGSSQLSIKAQTVFDAPYEAWNSNTNGQNNWLVATKFYEIEQGVVLRFHIQGAERGWQDYLLGDSKKEVLLLLEQLLFTLSSTNYFTVPLEHTARAELILLSNELPQSEILFNQLIKTNFALNEFDRAAILIEQQLHKPTSDLQIGLLHLLKANIYLWNNKAQIAGDSLFKALSKFRSLGLLHLEAKALIEQGWYYLATQQFRNGIQILNQAASIARTAHEPLLEVTAHLNQAFMASKAGQVELSHAQIGLAKELIALHKLDSVHQIQVLNNAIWLASSVEEKLSYNKDILLMPYSQQYGRYFYAAAKMVRDYYIEKQQWSAATESIMPWQRESFQLLSQAYVSFAQSNNEKGWVEAEGAFRLAQVNHYKSDALDAALLMLQAGGSSEKNTAKIHIAYIKQNATNRWLNQNMIAWQKINEGHH
ncbi:MAG: winged helix-turn-helix domain-containing protein [Gammaproteobacteria bacterium]|nr:winged helix-turn-helix domain-containing protein [Gammaproteobacteria bacterium]